NAGKCTVHLPDRFETEIRFRKHQTAYSKQFYPGARLEDEKSVLFATDDYYDLLRFYHFVLSD
ncbi:MAG: M55 family metallopeptidase, partial [Oscillospiraceae bacterium]